jgi:hypothetical protein
MVLQNVGLTRVMWRNIPEDGILFFKICPYFVSIKSMAVKVMCKYCDGVCGWNLNHNPVFLSVM